MFGSGFNGGLIVGPGMGVGGFASGFESVPVQTGGGNVPTGSVVDLGTLVDWTDGTFFDSWSSSSSTTSDGGANAIFPVWQMYYAHQQIRIPIGANLRTGTSAAGSNSWKYGISVSSVANTSGSFAAPSTISTNQSFNYTSGGTYVTTTNLLAVIPANRFFLIGHTVGPFYYARRTLANNRTAVVGATPYVTAINKIWVNSVSSDTFIVPTQLGGAGTSTQYDGIAPVRAVKFTIG